MDEKSFEIGQTTVEVDSSITDQRNTMLYFEMNKHNNFVVDVDPCAVRKTTCVNDWIHLPFDVKSRLR